MIFVSGSQKAGSGSEAKTSRIRHTGIFSLPKRGMAREEGEPRLVQLFQAEVPVLLNPYSSSDH